MLDKEHDLALLSSYFIFAFFESPSIFLGYLVLDFLRQLGAICHHHGKSIYAYILMWNTFVSLDCVSPICFKCCGLFFVKPAFIFLWKLCFLFSYFENFLSLNLGWHFSTKFIDKSFLICVILVLLQTLLYENIRRVFHPKSYNIEYPSIFSYWFKSWSTA